MATITTRKRADGTTAYRASIRIKRGGKIVHHETQTFDQKKHATEWAKKREVALGEPGALDAVLQKASVKDVLDWYIREYATLSGFGRSKLSNLKLICTFDIAKKNATTLTPQDLIKHVNDRRKEGAGPSTVNNDLIWIRVAFKAARPALGLSLNLQVIDDAAEFCRKQRLIAKPKERDRRPTKEELKQLSEWFKRGDKRAQIPMHDIMWFAIHSTRRQEEITRILHSDNNEADHTGVVRDAKHPFKKEGNHRTFKYTAEAWEIVKRQPEGTDRIFPYNPRSISANFTRACHMLEIDDLHFHDLRHEGTSRLFEAGYSIIEVQQFTLHESWNTLKRYTHLRPRDVKHR